jgi:LmbE family N-acetylglucosaminyl deacetylase
LLTTVTRALVLEPHPDDLVIGCAGLLQRLADQGAEVHSLLLSEVPATYSKIYDDSGAYQEYAGDVRMREVAAADQILGLDGRTVAFGSEWHHRLDALPAADLIRAIEECVSDTGADLVLVPARSYNQDHRAVFDAFQAVMRPHFYRGMALAYETTMERDFEPNVVVPLTAEQVERKLEACGAFVTQLGSAEHLFSLDTIELAARYRGRLAYATAAEAFQLLRGIYG